jgi:hypothetical protein
MISSDYPIARLVCVVDVLDLDITLLLVARGHDVGLNSLEIDVTNLCLITVEDLSDLLESWAPSLDVEDSDEDKFEEDPALANVSV